MKLKSAIRQEFKIKREFFKNNHYLKEKVLANAKRLIEEFLFGNELIVSAYYPIENEVDVLPLIEWLQQKKVLCALPKIKSPKSNDMEFLLFGADTPTKKNIFDVPEPYDSKVVVPDIMILPVLVCDLNGNRLGYGGGYYDRYLNKIKKTGKKVVTIGVCADEQIHHGQLPEESHDQKLGFIVTEKRIYRL